MESLDKFRRFEVHENARNVFVMSLRLSDHKVLHNIASVLLKFFRFRSDFVLQKFCSLRNLIKQLFHSRLLDMKLVIANLALGASLAIYHLISNKREWNNCLISMLLGSLGSQKVCQNRLEKSTYYIKIFFMFPK